MDETDRLLKNLETEFGPLSDDPTDRLLEELALEFGPPTPQKPSYGIGQTLFDIPAAAYRNVGGLVDLPIMGGESLMQALGYDVKLPRMSTMISKDIERAAEKLGVRPETGVQELTEFLIPVGKAKLGAQLGAGLLGYGGYKTGEALAGDIGGLVGAVAAPLSAARAARTIAPRLERTGLALQRTGLGVTKGDYNKSRNQFIEVPENVVDDATLETQLSKSFNELLEENVISPTKDPKTIRTQAKTALRATEKNIQTAIANAEKTLTETPTVDYNRAFAWIEDNVPTEKEKDKYLDYIIDLQDSFNKKAKTKQDGALRYLNQQKKAVGQKWKSPQTDPTYQSGFWRALYSDLRSGVEKYVPEVSELNRKKQNLIVALPILDRAAKGTFKLDMRDLARITYTTGSFGLPGAYMLGGPAGAALASGAALAGTPRGQRVIGGAMRGLGQRIPTPEDPLVKALQGLAISQREKEMTGE